MYLRINSVNAHRAALGIEPRTSRTLSENHTTRPSSQLQVRLCVFLTVLSRARCTSCVLVVCFVYVLRRIVRWSMAAHTQ